VSDAEALCGAAFAVEIGDNNKALQAAREKATKWLFGLAVQWG
jgi:hypothetical protein